MTTRKSKPSAKSEPSAVVDPAPKQGPLGERTHHTEAELIAAAAKATTPSED